MSLSYEVSPRVVQPATSPGAGILGLSQAVLKFVCVFVPGASPYPLSYFKPSDTKVNQ